jgi:hypothetical protein
MTATLFFDPQARPLSNAGITLPDATLTFYLTATTTLEDVYADADLQTPLTNPVEADSDGRFPFIYMDPAVTYRVQLHTADAVLVWDVDPYYPPRDFQPGTVIWFYGTSEQRDTAYPPALWAVLDGNNGTPNGLDRFPIIAGGDYDPGDTGGNDTDTATTTDEDAHTHAGGTTDGHAITVDEMPAHFHETKGNYVSGGYDGGGNQFYRARTSDAVQNAAGDFMANTGGGQAHTHGGGTTGAGSAHSHSVTVDTVPPYVALWAVMRKYP